MSAISFVILGIVCVVYYLWHYRRTRRWIKTINRIPGPKTTPFVGNLFDDILADRKKAVLGIKKYFNEYGPIVRFWAARYPFVHIANAELAEIILASNVSIAKGVAYNLLEPWLGKGLLTSTGKKWHKKRKILTPAFHFSILETFVESFTKNSQILIDRLEKEMKTGKVNIVPYFSECTLDIICETAMGVEVNIQKGSSREYLNAVHKINETLSERAVNLLYYSDFIHRFTANYENERKSLEILHKMSRNVIQRRLMERQKKTEDTKTPAAEHDEDNIRNRKKKAFIDLLLDISAHGDQYSTLEDVREEVDTFMFEGHDTTSTALSWTTFLIGCHQDVQDKIIAELKNVFGQSNRTPTIKDIGELSYLDSVIKESLRLFPPVPVLSRVALEEIKFGDYTIPSGTDLVLHIHQIHRSPKYYENPNEFNPSNFSAENAHRRDPFVYIPFSGGPRNCIGQRFALLQMKVILSSLLKRFRVTSLQKEDEVSIISDLVLRSENGLWVRLEKRE